MNNRQAALIAAASFFGGEVVETGIVYEYADNFTKYLNSRDQELDQEMRDLGIRE